MAYTDPFQYAMKIGKFKGKTLFDLSQTDVGKNYIGWFVENIIKEENEKYYGKILQVYKTLGLKKKEDM